MIQRIPLPRNLAREGMSATLGANMSSLTARLLTLLAVILFSPACRYFARTRPLPPAAAPVAGPIEPVAPSPRLIVGRVIAVDLAQRFATVELAGDAPRGALVDGVELGTRTPELKPTGQLQVSRYARGRTLGTRVLGGQPAPGDEVVWLAP